MSFNINDCPSDCPYRQHFPAGPGSFPFAPPPLPPIDGQGGPGGPPHQGPPSGPPPSHTPTQPHLGGSGGPGGPGVQPYAVDPGALRPCTYRYVYLWLRNGNSFWAWLTFVGPRSASGFRWNGFNWVYFGIDLRRIVSFQCY